MSTQADLIPQLAPPASHFERRRPADAVKSMLPFVACAAVAVVLQFCGKAVLGDYAARLVIDAGIAVMLAASLNLVNGMTGQFSIGHAGFMAVGGYAAAACTYYGSLMLWGDSVRHGGVLGGGEWLFLGACLTGGVFAAAAGWVVGLPTLRLRGDYLAIVTLGFGEIIRVLIQQTKPVIYDAQSLSAASASQLFPPPLGGSLGFSDVPKYTNLFWVGLFVSATLLVSWRLKSSSVGRAMLAIREDELAAQLMGVNVTRVKVRSFVVSAFFAGLAGSLFAHESGVILGPRDAGFQRSFDIVIMVVLGGKGSISGAVIAAVLLTLLPEFLRDFADYRLIVYALLLIGMMLLRPQGLLGTREVWEYVPFIRRRLSETGR